MMTFVTNSIFLKILIFKILPLIAAFLVTKKLIIPFIKSEKWQDRISFYLPVIFTVVLFFIILEIIITAGISYPLITIGIGALVLIMLWSYIKEWSVGVVFKFQKGNITGQRIKLENVNGIVQNLRSNHLVVSSDQGDVLHIPYSKVVNSIVSKPSIARNLKTVNIEYNLHYDEIVLFKEKLLRKIAKSPYVVHTIPPKFELVKSDAENVKYRLVLYTIDEKYLPNIRTQLK